MRRASSAPSLISLSNQAPPESHTQPLAARIPKVASTSAVSKLAAHGLQRDVVAKREGSLPTRLRSVRSRALPSFEPPMPLPSEPLVAQEFAEAARGLAALECFELYGPLLEAPPLSSQADATNAGQHGPSVKQFDAKAAVASCLATPVTGEDKNLGELVESEARAIMKATEQRVTARYEMEVRLGQGLVLEEVASAEEERHVLYRRKRKLVEKIRESLGGRFNKQAAAQLFANSPEAQQLLQDITSQADSTNRIEVPEGYTCIGDICFPVERFDDSIFHTEPPAPHKQAPGAAIPAYST